MVTPDADLSFLTRCEWLPPTCDAARALTAIEAGAVGPVWDLQKHAASTALPVVERLAIAFSLLRGYASTLEAPPGVMAALDHIGLEVSPEFAEQGPRAAAALRAIDALARGQVLPMIQVEHAAAAVGTLWESAFEAPSGYAHYITRSLMGRVPADWSFFRPPASETPLEGPALGARLRWGLDLLHTAIALHHRPTIMWPDDVRTRPTWRSPVASIESGRGSRRPNALALHARAQGVGVDPIVQHLSLWLGYPGEEDPAAWVEGTVLYSQTGTVEEFVELVESRQASNPLVAPEEVVSEEARRQIQSVFASPDMVGIYPRVRRLLDRSEHRVHRLLVVEHMSVAPDWRGRALGQRLLQQLLAEAGDVEIVLGRPRIALPDAVLAQATMGVQAAEAMTALRQAHAWSGFGAEYLINGVMGLALPQIQMARVNASWERQPQV